MKIDRVHVDGFGRLQGFDTGSSALPGLVAVLGPNEAGKSTLFAFLTTALYGFLPATRERNPAVPWGADEAGGRVRLRLDAGGCAEVERRLRSQPSAKLTMDGVTTELRNQPVPWVEHVPRTVFRQVFALTLAELAVLDSDTWARIQDKVVGTMGATDLRSARAVAETLEREAGEIWRPNRRGNQRLRDLQGEARALRARRHAAHERDAQVRALVEEAARVHERLRDARAQRQLDRLALERVQSWLPVRKRQERIAELRRQGGDRSSLSGLPADPLARWEDLEAERELLARRRAMADAELAERRATVEAFDDQARALLARSEDIVRLQGRAATCAAERSRVAELATELQGVEEELDARAATLFTVAWRDVPAAELESLPLDLLRDRVARARVSPPSTPVRIPRALTVAGLVGGVALLAWGAASGSVAAVGGGAGLAAVALTLLLVTRRPGAWGGAALQAEIRAALATLPVRPEHLERPSEQLVSGLGRIQALMRERAHTAHALDAARGRVAAIDAEAEALARQLGVSGAAAEELAHTLDLGVRRAEQLQLAATTAERDARKRSAERAEASRDLERVDAGRERLRTLAEKLAPGDARAGLTAARDRLAAHRRADELTEELERAHPDRAEVEAQMAAAEGPEAAWGLDEEQLGAARGRLESLEEEIETLVKEAEALARDAAHMRELETVDAVESEIVSLRELETELVRERDRKWVLAKLLREADRRFREEHQPDLLRRASSYLRHLTGGRYERLVVDERDDAGLFQIIGPGLPAPVALADPVSTGTLEQAYLSLRLAIVDHLDQGGERLPLFVDEVFVNWDRERRARGLEVIAGVARGRQVFVFTCHEGLAADLEGRGASVLELGPA